jgi:hypothetical protein
VILDNKHTHQARLLGGTRKVWLASGFGKVSVFPGVPGPGLGRNVFKTPCLVPSSPKTSSTWAAGEEIR